MIVNGTLTYATAIPPFLHRELSSTIPNLVAIAAVTTVLSFQFAALISDILLGSWRRRIVSASTLHILLLTRTSSPLAVFASLVRHDFFTRAYYGKDIPKDTSIARDNEPVRIATAIRLLILLLAAPMTSIAFVGLTLSADNTVSFFEAGFGGLALGLSTPDRNLVKGKRISQGCAIVPLKEGVGDNSLAEFAMCVHPLARKVPFNAKEASLGVILESNASILLFVDMGKTAFLQMKTVSVFANGTVYFLQPELSPTSVHRFLDFGMDLVARACGMDRSTERNDTISFDESFPYELIGARFLSCEISSVEEANRLATEIMFELDDLITFVEAETIMVAEYTNTADYGGIPNLPFIEGSELPLLTRRRRYLALSALCILAAIILVLRMLISLVWCNKVGTALEWTIKEALGYHCCENPLYAKEVVSFNSKHQEGKIAHYGLPKSNMSQVAQFSGGTLGLRSWELVQPDPSLAPSADRLFRNVKVDHSGFPRSAMHRAEHYPGRMLGRQKREDMKLEADPAISSDISSKDSSSWST